MQPCAGCRRTRQLLAGVGSDAGALRAAAALVGADGGPGDLPASGTAAGTFASAGSGCTCPERSSLGCWSCAASACGWCGALTSAAAAAQAPAPAVEPAMAVSSYRVDLIHCDQHAEPAAVIVRCHHGA